MSTLVNSVAAAVSSIRNIYIGQIDTAIVLGSGLSDLTLDGFEEISKVDYKNIVGLPHATAPSHKGEISFISNGKSVVALCAGRHHLYEGHSAQDVATLAYVMAQLGAKELIITNAAGALNPDYRPGDIMFIEDHINMTGQNPVRGQDDTFGVTFPDMSKAYELSRLFQAKEIAENNAIRSHQGVYIGVMGPSLETSAERRMMRGFGADAVGMSTVLEVIAANHCGMKVLGMSAITNLALGDENQAPDTIEEVLENAAVAGKGMKLILNELLT
jgi:purine-nucleoside phosphorylase